MTIEEGNSLLTTKYVTSEDRANILDRCINNSNPKVTFLILLILALGNAADAVEIMCIGFIMTEIEDITQSDKEFLSAAVFLGMLVGGILGGYLSDLRGRKPCLLSSLLLNSVAGFVSAFSPDVNSLITLRVIGGIGIGASVPIVFSLGAEMFPSAVRGKYLSVIASFWMVGAIYTSLFAWLMLGDDLNGDKIMPSYVGWRSFAVVASIPAISTFILTLNYLPESPRYLVNKGKAAKASEILCHMTGGVVIDPSSLTMSESEQAMVQVDLKSATLSLLSPDLRRYRLILLLIHASLL